MFKMFHDEPKTLFVFKSNDYYRKRKFPENGLFELIKSLSSSC